MTYSVRYINSKGEESWTKLPLKLRRTTGRKAKVVNAMQRIFGKVTVLEIGVSK